MNVSKNTEFVGVAPAPKRGRPAVPDEQRLTEAFNLRLTGAQSAKLESMGGAQWLRNQIDKAKS